MRPILLIVLLTVLTVGFKDCNFTNFNFISNYSLGKQDELNKTFQLFNNQSSNLTDVICKPSQNVTYTLSRIKAQAVYLDSSQAGEVIGDDIIYIKGGRVQADIVFEWGKNNQTGNGLAQCLSNSISFAKLVYSNQGFLMYKLADFQNISFINEECKISRVDPPLDTSDLLFLSLMFNENNGTNVKGSLQLQIMKNYEKDLSKCLYDERQQLTNSSEYVWVKERANFSIKYQVVPTGYHLKLEGLSTNFVTEIQDDDQWKCGKTVPSTPLNTTIYGGSQEFISLSVFQNSLRYAIQKGQLDSTLDRQSWESNAFQFFAGDLYEIVPILQNKYLASSAINGICKASASGFTMQINGDLIQAQIRFNCRLDIQAQQIMQFTTDVTFSAQVTPDFSSLNFYVVKTSKSAQFIDVGEYKVHNLQLANFYLGRSLSRMLGTRVIGSGWLTFSRNDPKVKLFDGYMVIFDQSQLHDVII